VQLVLLVTNPPRPSAVQLATGEWLKVMVTVESSSQPAEPLAKATLAPGGPEPGLRNSGRPLAVGVGVAVSVTVGDAVSVGVWVAVDVDVGVLAGVGDGVNVRVLVAVGGGVGVAVGVGVGLDAAVTVKEAEPVLPLMSVTDSV
jgi:hypothetical protein